ncbi:MAG TPA: nitrite reductase small subunit NirD [Nitriliruptorales bacterium]
MTWVAACPLEQIARDTGVCARVGGQQVAVFRLRDGRLFALHNRDPLSGVNVLSRGIVGDVAGTDVVASPLHKQRFDLATGRCLDADGVAVATYPVAVRDGIVHVGLPAQATRR